MSKLQTWRLIKSYHGRKVVNGISVEINSKEIVGLLGPNGAGKTTSFYMIVGLVAPDQGKIFLDRNNITHHAMHERAHLGIGYLPQEASIFRKLSVADNIMSVLQLRKELDKKQRKNKLENLMEEFHVSHLRNSLGISLSGGERRRVEIARALAMEPKFILLDEPFAGIDPISVVDIKRIIKQLQKLGIGVLITDHNVKETLDICSRAYIVGTGEIIANGSPKEILQNKKVRDVYLGDEFEL
ncbi:MAG: LPS export ABC transporter ATP-binding protein [Gammaproteobacteria bacterium]|nr:LPS export ABC transporter ATP-binding protein [Gammaproteobacteria bacterium]